QTDPKCPQYLGGPYTDAATGRFLTVDRFAGKFEDPQSLHKYLYAHANPINNTDPSGQFILGLLGGLMRGLQSTYAIGVQAYLVANLANAIGTGYLWIRAMQIT